MSKYVEEIIDELKVFNIKRNSLGYEYLLEAIYIVSQNKMTIRDFNKYVYTPIAVKYRTRSINIFWSMDKVINLMYLNTDPSIIEEYFNISRYEKLSTKAFIIAVARKVSVKKEECLKFEKFGNIY